MPLSGDTVAMLGCGSVGGFAAWALASAGVGGLLLADKDRLEAKNLVRHACGDADVGAAKPPALHTFLYERFPATRIEAHEIDFLEHVRELRELIARSSAVVVAVDAEGPKHLIDAMARELRRPVVYAGVYGGGWAAEVILSEDETPCYACAARSLGRSGVNVAAEAGPDYALPAAGRPESEWHRADLTSVLPVSAFAARVVVAALKASRGAPAALDELTRGGASAWRLLHRDVPGWGRIGETISPEISPWPACWSCGNGPPQRAQS